MVTGPLYGDLAVLQACRAYEQAAGTAWPPAGLEARLAAIAAAGCRASRPSAGRLGDSRRADRLLHSPAVAAYSLTTEMREVAMANKEQKRSSREAKKPKQKKKGTGKKSGPSQTTQS